MKLLIAFLVALLTTLDTRAQGLIWSANSQSGASVTPGSSWQIALDHVSDPFSGLPPSLNPVTGIFSITISTNNSGQTFFASALNEPGFGGFVASLTDGTSGWVRFQNGPPISWLARYERDFLGRSSVSPDFAGYTITQIGFRVNNFYDYFDVQEDQYFRQLDYSLDFYGAPVPEPSTWALLTLGTAALLLRRKARPQPPAPPK